MHSVFVPIQTLTLPAMASNWQMKEELGGEGSGERENSNLNSKTLFYKDCSLASVKNLSNN